MATALVGLLIFKLMPGGGGLGNAAERDPALVVEDIRNGYISKESAREVYRVAVRDDLSVDAEGTAKLRGRRT